MASPEPQADPPKKIKSRTIRIHVDLKEQAPGTIVCYADLLKQALKTAHANTTTTTPQDEEGTTPLPDSEGADDKHVDPPSEEAFFQNLLARSAKYNLADDHDDEDSSSVCAEITIF